MGNVVVFLPQILLLFFFIGLLEDSGYMARVAYLMDRVMKTLGLHGRAFVPMLSGFACAVPAIMATRTMERQRDRLLTMLVVPLMTCSARLPVYTLIIAALFPPRLLFGFLPLQGLTMIGLYAFSIVLTLAVGGRARQDRREGPPHPAHPRASAVPRPEPAPDAEAHARALSALPQGSGHRDPRLHHRALGAALVLSRRLQGRRARARRGDRSAAGNAPASGRTRGVGGLGKKPASSSAATAVNSARRSSP